MQSLIALIIGGRVKHTVIHQTIVISMQHLPYQEEILFQPIRKAPQPAHKAFIQTISHIQAQTIYSEFIHPEFYAFQNIIDHFLVSEIQLYQIIMSFPALIPQTIIVIGISFK